MYVLRMKSMELRQETNHLLNRAISWVPEVIACWCVSQVSSKTKLAASKQDLISTNPLVVDKQDEVHHCAKFKFQNSTDSTGIWKIEEEKHKQI